MAYTKCETINPRHIGNRIIPAMYKLSRADGSFDLFIKNSHQANCIQYLCNKQQAGVFAGRYNSDDIRGLGEFSINTDSSNFTKLSMQVYDGTLYNSIPYCSFRLKLNNNANIYPYQISGYNYSDKNAGARILQVYKGSSWITKAGGGYSQGNWGGGSNSDRKEATLWSFNPNNLSTIFDWKDYSEIRVMFRAVDGSKFTGSGTSLTVNFIHRLTNDHELYRYYT